MKKIIFPLISLMTLYGCREKANEISMLKSNLDESNPFAKESTLPYNAPDFSKIKNSDFKPALLEGMRVHLMEIEDIANSSASPTFENTLVNLEKAGQLLNRTATVFSLLAGANSDSVLLNLQEEMAAKFAEHEDLIFMNEKLFKRVELIHNQLKTLKLNTEQQRLVNFYYDKFVSHGANLSAKDKTILQKYNQELATLAAQFSNRLLEAANSSALKIKDKSELAGLSEAELKAYKKGSEWVIPLQNTTQQPDFMNLENRETRKKLFDASWNRNEKDDANDTRNLILKIAKLRADKAKILGYKNFAEWTLQDQMAKVPSNVDAFLTRLGTPAVAKAKLEAQDIQEMIDKKGEKFALEAYDWDYYAEMVRKEKYDLDEKEIKPYFELKDVLEKGVFYAAQKLYGITFKERKDIPVYHEDVRVFEVFNEDGSTVGLFYGDFYKRSNKNGGAWMENLVGQSFLLDKKPVVYNVCNFTKPAKGQPALLSFDDVTTLFHEFGHALHGLFANQEFPSLAGANTPRDFVEFPSQFNENWALYPEILTNYALHYKTNQVIPQTLIDKIKSASTFNQGYALTELIEAATLDMKWHELSAGQAITNVDEFEKNSLQQTGLFLPQVPPRYRSSYFLHIFSNGYSAGYYAYLWTEMLDHDAYAWFEENGGLTRKNGQRYRDMILSKGNTEDFATMYRNFRGRDASIEPMKQARGLVE
jgi:peptidyl-dipeptidase Dcp